MDKCPICGKTGFSGGVCPECGYDESRNYERYLSLTPLDGRGIPSVAGRRARWSEMTAKQQLASLEIRMEVYYYALDGDTLNLDRTEELTLVSGEQLRDGETVWSKVKFPRIEDMDQLPVTLYLKRGDQSRRCRLVIENPGGTSDWRLGIRYHAGKRPEAELVIDNAAGAYANSDRFSLEV